MRDITTRTTVPVTTPLRPPRAGKGKPAEEKTAPGIQFPFRQTLRPFLRAQRQARPAGGLFSEPPSPFAGLFQPGVCQTTRTGSCENISKINSVKPKARLFPRTREGAFLLLPPLFSLFLVAVGPDLMVNIDWDKAEAVFFSSTPYPLTFAHYTDKYGGWCISPYYNTYLGRFGECLNKLNDDSKINYWKDSKAAGDEGSVVEFTDLKTAYANLVESYKERINEDNCVGGYSQEVFDASGLASATTPEEYAEAFTYLNEHTTRLADDGLYRIKCAPLRGSYNLSFDADAARLDVGTANTTSASQIWKITQTTDGKYALTSQGKGLGGGDLGKVDQVVPITDASEATTFYVRRGLAEGTLGKEGLLWSFDHTFDCISNWEYHSTALNLTADNDVTYMQNYHPSSVWYIIPATSLDLTVGVYIQNGKTVFIKK